MLCWNRTTLRPFLGPEHVADRLADLDGYVDYPRAAALAPDVVLVDGRKRRRCLLTALDLIGPKAVVLLPERLPAALSLRDGRVPGISLHRR